ncbi:MAG: hypothetical protein ACOC97_03045 [Myxococcota bacterium]
MAVDPWLERGEMVEPEEDHPFAPVSDYSAHAAGMIGAFRAPEERPPHAVVDRDAVHAGKRELRWFALEQATQDERRPEMDLYAAEEAAIHEEAQEEDSEEAAFERKPSAR